ncbi:hypothetical protein LCGC14_1210430 [marine sediment metagenome]|uniref:Uncharacterized protein n=1 Tax=marine sediment metagenome TaxID=412755 RepID=A0A0F9M1L9_9ZZZZ
MSKLGTLAWIIGLVIIVNLLLLITVPFLADITVSTNLTLNATSNMSQYPGTSGFLLATPWILYFIPNVAGIIAVIVVLRRQP